MDGLLEYVKKSATAFGAHDVNHLLRVWRIAKRIGVIEGANLKVLEAMALLHDIVRPENADEKYHAGSSAEVAKKILKNFGYSENEIELVVSGILSHSIHSNSGVVPQSTEAKILFDADKIEAVGPIGISRWFFTTAKKDISLESAVILYLQTVDDYKKSNKRLYTVLGNKLIKTKLIFSVNFMENLLKELKQMD